MSASTRAGRARLITFEGEARSGKGTSARAARKALERAGQRVTFIDNGQKYRVLARLAVDHRQQGKGLGKALLKDAILRTMQAAEIAGLKLLLVHAKDETAADFYRKQGFEPVIDDPLRLFLPVPLSSS